ncbi:GFA family protein [Tianweitania sp. BSSL-BM11]|uniref:GFA family protein n=1 Tax=Tianweitania aestuarii TaxID=2814886 RepID=A0ABS5RZG7_9HYPH|nr:GFA family protein [Tianweitania aestuarii]MBS9721696.1 GFA family protein [Tianweitania aestuarii]
MSHHTASCRCGAIRFEAHSDPVFSGYCHCTDCRRATGSPVAAFVGFNTQDSRFIGKAPATFGKAPVTRSFCADCGAPIAYADARLPDRVFIMLGAMDAPNDYPPTMHSYAGNALSFFHLDDDLPRLEANAVPRP